MAVDSECKYVNVRRLLLYLEQSISRGLAWAVFEPNGAPLWANLREAVMEFLLRKWRDGALVSRRPEEAFYVRCDRATIMQADIDSGHIVCEIGVASRKPAEFVIFRVEQQAG